MLQFICHTLCDLPGESYMAIQKRGNRPDEAALAAPANQNGKNVYQHTSGSSVFIETLNLHDAMLFSHSFDHDMARQEELSQPPSAS